MKAQLAQTTRRRHLVLCIYHSINVKTEERYGAPIHKASVQTVLSSVCVPCGPWPRLSSGLYLWPTEAHSGVGARPCSIFMQGAGGMKGKGFHVDVVQEHLEKEAEVRFLF